MTPRKPSSRTNAAAPVRRSVSRALLLALLALALAVPARAEGVGDVLSLPELAAAAPPEAAEAVGDPDAAAADPDAGLAKLLEFARAHLPDAAREALRPLLSIVAVCALCAAAEGFAPAGGDGGAEAAHLAGCLAIALIGAQDVHSVLRLGTDTLSALHDFSRAALPMMTTAAAATGAPGAAGAVWAASALFSDVLLSAAETVVAPLLRGCVALSSATAVLGDKRLEGAAGFLRWCARAALRALAAAYAAYLTLTRALGAAADAATVKTAKAVLSNAVPVVGKLLADASEALVAGAGLVRAAAGVYGLLVVLGTVLLPALRLSLRCLAFRAVAAVCASLAGERESRLIAALSGVYSLLLGLVCTAAAVDFLAIISLIRTVAQ